MGSKIGILGGTFDPIHMGHLITAETARDAAGLDRILFIPTGCSYFKEDQHVTPPLLRYEMVCAAVKDRPEYEVSDIETSRPGNSYTAVTLEELRVRFPDDRLYYIVGADTLVMMDLWKDPQKIFRSCTILVMARSDEVSRKNLEDEAAALRAAFGADIVILPERNIEISSTEIRGRVRDGRSIRYLVPDAVEALIRENRLYLEP